MPAVVETVELGRNNKIELLLKDDSSGTLAATDLSSTTRVVLEVNGETVDSSSRPGAFDWSEGGGKLVLSLGGESLSKGSNLAANVIVYTNQNTSGIVWGRGKLRLNIH